jgi:hypothetical protein
MKRFLVICAVLLVVPAMGVAQVKVVVLGGEKIGRVPSDGPKLIPIIQVKLPFDEEYRIRLNNTDHARRVLVHIKIDGRAVTGDGLILRTSETVDLERFLDAGSLTQGKRFKFIPKADEPLRKEKPEDGVITVAVQYEKPKGPLVEYGEEYRGSWGNFIPVTGSVSLGTTNADGNIVWTSKADPSESEKGITVEGSESRQRFQKEEIGEMESRIDTLVIQLIGYWKKPPILMRGK